jgi:hypothetical protein
MATIYLSYGEGVNSNTGIGAWANAVQTLKYAVETVAVAQGAGPHTILWDRASSEELAADTTITAAHDLRIISVDRDNSDAPLAGAVIGAQATNYSLTFNGAFDVYVFGVQFSNGTGATLVNFIFNSTDGGHFEFEECYFYLTDSSAGAGVLLFHGASVGFNNFTKLMNCTLRFSTAGDSIRCSAGRLQLVGCTVSADGTTIGTLFTNRGACYVSVEGCDIANAGSTALVANQTDGTGGVTFANCKVRSAVVPLVTAATVLNRGNVEVWMFNCSSADTHFHMFHGDAFGTTTVSDTIYADDGAKYDGTNGCSWVITTRANNCSFYTPYVSPWIDKYHAGTSAITMSLECLRDGNTTVYDNDEVWGEFSYQGNTGSTQADFANDRMALLGTPAAQTASTIAWTGGTTPGKFKLESGSVTPAEIGHLRARVCVGEPSITVYVDPTIRT